MAKADVSNRQESTYTGTVDSSRIIKNDDGTITVQVKVRDNNDNIIGGSIYRTEDGLKADEDIPLIALEEVTYKIDKYSDKSESYIKFQDDTVGLYGSADNRMVSSEKYGNVISGPVSFTSHIEAIRLGSLFRINGLNTSTMPSTIVTPVSMLTIDVPGKDLLISLKNMFSIFADLVV